MMLLLLLLSRYFTKGGCFGNQFDNKNGATKVVKLAQTTDCILNVPFQHVVNVKENFSTPLNMSFEFIGNKIRVKNKLYNLQNEDIFDSVFKTLQVIQLTLPKPNGNFNII